MAYLTDEEMDEQGRWHDEQRAAEPTNLLAALQHSIDQARLVWPSEEEDGPVDDFDDPDMGVHRFDGGGTFDGMMR